MGQFGKSSKTKHTVFIRRETTFSLREIFLEFLEPYDTVRLIGWKPVSIPVLKKTLIHEGLKGKLSMSTMGKNDVVVLLLPEK